MANRYYEWDKFAEGLPWAQKALDLASKKDEPVYNYQSDMMELCAKCLFKLNRTKEFQDLSDRLKELKSNKRTIIRVSQNESRAQSWAVSNNFSRAGHSVT